MNAVLARLLLCLALLFAWPAAAQQELEIIPLRSQTVDRVLPTLLPLVEPGGTLIGANDQLFLRASQRNREEIKRVLATIDRPSRRLIIRVSQNRESEGGSRGGEVSGRVVIGDSSRSRVDARLWDSQGTRSENAGQMVQTVEGGQAFIQVGRTLPIPMRQATIGPGGALISETVVFHDIGRGFFATPRRERRAGDHRHQPAGRQRRRRRARQRQHAATVNHRFRSPRRVDRTGRQQPPGQRQSGRQFRNFDQRRAGCPLDLAQGGGSEMSLKRHIGQQVALATAAFCALLTLPAFGLFVWLWKERGLADTWTPSALAAVAFLGACAVVLYVMSRPQPPLPEETAAVDR